MGIHHIRVFIIHMCYYLILIRTCSNSDILLYQNLYIGSQNHRVSNTVCITFNYGVSVCTFYVVLVYNDILSDLTYPHISVLDKIAGKERELGT